MALLRSSGLHGCDDCSPGFGLDKISMERGSPEFYIESIGLNWVCWVYIGLFGFNHHKLQGLGFLS